MQLASLLRHARSLLVLLAFAAGTVHAAEVSAPVMLVATERLAGSAYRETVLIAAPLRNGAFIGFIVNRPTGLKLDALFPEHAPSRKVVDPVYFGGPQLAGSLFVIARRTPQGKGAGGEVIPLSSGLVVVLDAATVDRVIETMPNDARYFAGLVVWRPGELDEEIRAGAWQVLPADPKRVFHANPAGLWRDLHRGEGGTGRAVRIRLEQPQPARAPPSDVTSVIERLAVEAGSGGVEHGRPTRIGRAFPRGPRSRRPFGDFADRRQAAVAVIW